MGRRSQKCSEHPHWLSQIVVPCLCFPLFTSLHSFLSLKLTKPFSFSFSVYDFHKYVHEQDLERMQSTPVSVTAVKLWWQNPLHCLTSLSFHCLFAVFKLCSKTIIFYHKIWRVFPREEGMSVLLILWLYMYVRARGAFYRRSTLGFRCRELLKRYPRSSMGTVT